MFDSTRFNSTLAYDRRVEKINYLIFKGTLHSESLQCKIISMHNKHNTDNDEFQSEIQFLLT